MAVATILTAFAAGELAPSLYGRVDQQKYHVGASTIRNAFVDYRGGVKSRPGTKYVGQCKQTGNAAPPRLIAFGFSITQGYILEFGDHYIRFIQNGAYITETPVNIVGITNANPAVVSVSAMPFNNSDWVSISGVTGMLEINNRTLIVASAASGNFNVLDSVTLNAVDSTDYGTATANTGTAARIYEITSPWSVVDLPLLKFSQSADTLSICHPNYPPQDLQRFGNTDWRITPTQFGEPIAPPTGLSATASVTASGASAIYRYVVTAIDDETGGESIASATVGIDDGVLISETAGTNTITWATVPGASNYNVYRAPETIFPAVPPIGSMFGFVGRAFGNQFADTNFVPDFSTVPPQNNNPFSPGAILGVDPVDLGSGYSSPPDAVITSSTGSGAIILPVVTGGGDVTSGVVGYIIKEAGQNYTSADTVSIVATPGGGGSGATAKLVIGPLTGTYPGVVGYFQQRRVYAATNNNPDTYFLSKPGNFTNFDTSIPTVDDDAITGTPWALAVNGIQFITGMVSGLILFTGAGCWLLSGGQLQQAITPSNQVVNPEGFHGCAQLCPPIPIDYDVLFVQAKGSVVRDLQFNFWSQFYQSSEVTTLSNHLFAGHSLREWAYAAEPNKIIWAVRDDGVLLSFTFFKEQDVFAWTRHDTG